MLSPTSPKAVITLLSLTICLACKTPRGRDHIFALYCVKLSLWLTLEKQLMIMQLSRVLGYQANKSGINAWLDGIRGNFCVPVVHLQQVKGNNLKTSYDKEQFKNKQRFQGM